MNANGKPRRKIGKAIPVAPPRIPTPMPPPKENLPLQRQRNTNGFVNCTPASTHNNLSSNDKEVFNAVKASAPKMDRNGYFSYITSTAKKKKINLMQSRAPRLAFTTTEGYLNKPYIHDPHCFSIATSVEQTRRVPMSHKTIKEGPRGRRSDYLQLESYQPVYHHSKNVKSVRYQCVDDYNNEFVGKRSGQVYVVPDCDVGKYRRKHHGNNQIPGTHHYRSQKSHSSNNGSPHRRKRHTDDESIHPHQDGFCTTIQKYQPTPPPALLRRLGVKEQTGFGKVKVMLRVSGAGDGPITNGSHTFTLDKRKKQVTLYENPTASVSGTIAPEDRKVGVSAPKMFAFDAIFSQDDTQTEICSSALSDVIHAVINGTDGCLFCFGHPGIGKSYTMIGNPENGSLGAIPCAISWLFRGIAEQRHKCGTRFSIRVSAVEVCGHSNQLKDLLGPYHNESEQSPGVYLRDDPLFGTQLQNHSELRVHTPEKAAFYLDAALAARIGKLEGRDSHLLYTLHVYQYSVGTKGAGGRSRLHLIDLGNSDRGKASGGIPLSGLGNILLAIFNGQRHLPYRDHSLTHVLRECLGSLTCHTAMIVHVSPKEQNYSDTLTTLQLASRIHRLRRRKMKYTPNNNSGSGGSSGEDVAKGPSSSEPDPSSSDLSADTVIYVGPIDDATDGEHPPVYIPSINSGDNRGILSKALRGSAAEHRGKSSLAKVIEERSPVHKQNSPKNSPMKTTLPNAFNSPKHTPSSPNLKTPVKKHSIKPIHEDMKSKSPLFHGSVNPSDEQWIDGPRVAKSKIFEAQNIIKESTHAKKKEMWVDGPMKQPVAVPLQVGVLNALGGGENIGYGYMDSHKKCMIRKWVENQTQISKSKNNSPVHKNKQNINKESPKNYAELEQVIKESHRIEESKIRTGLKAGSKSTGILEEPEQVEYSQVQKPRLSTEKEVKSEPIDDDDDSEEMAEIPPPLPIISPLSSREASVENLELRRSCTNTDNTESMYQSMYRKDHFNDEDEILEIIEVEEPLEPVPMRDCCLQVTEEDIAYCSGLLLEEHPLSILSRENLTVASTFTDSLSITSEVERQMRTDECLRRALHIDARSECEMPSARRDEWLAGLRDLYISRLAVAACLPSEPPHIQSISLSNVRDAYDFHGDGSVYSEPPYKPRDSYCDGCGRTNDEDLRIYLNSDNYHKSTDPIDLFSNQCVGAARIASLRHPDGASDPNLREEKTIKTQPRYEDALKNRLHLEVEAEANVSTVETKPEKGEYDSGHESTPRTSKHSPAGTSRRAESGYDSVIRDSDISSLDSYAAKGKRQLKRSTTAKYKTNHDRSFCSWLRNPFACKNPDTDAEISDF